MSTLFGEDTVREHLTLGHGALERNIRKSFAGMAHFAGTGPDDKTCRECQFWRSEGWSAGGPLKAGACAKFRQMMQKPGPKVPHSASACKYFDENPMPPQAFQP